MVTPKHWTANSNDAFVYRIASDFIIQLEKKMNGHISHTKLAERLGVSKGRVSQVFNNPGNLTLKRMVEYSRALGIKVSVVAYDDGDTENANGPINSEIFYQCWKNCGSPANFYSLPVVANSGYLLLKDCDNVTLTSSVQEQGNGRFLILNSGLLSTRNTASPDHHPEQSTTGANCAISGGGN